MLHTVKCIKDFPPTADVKYDEDLWNRQHGDAFVIINCHATDIYYPEHWTPLSIKCAFNGKEYYKLRNTTYAVKADNFLVLNQGAEYASYILSDTVTESFTLNFTQNNLRHLATMRNKDAGFLLNDPFAAQETTAPFIEKLYSLSDKMAGYIQHLKTLSKENTLNTFAINELSHYILNELFNLNNLSLREAETIPAIKKSTREELYKRLNVAKDYLASCYPEEISLDGLARTCFMNSCYLLREFKKLYHITPHQYLTNIRLQEAKTMLLTTQKPVLQILQEVGFQDSSSFAKLFKKRFGMSPVDFRNK